MAVKSFKAKIRIIGINPYVLLPVAALNSIFKESEKDKGPIPVRGKLNGKNFIQTLVKYSGKWRLYLNTPMRLAGKCDVGDTAEFSVQFDAKPRTTKMPLALKKALADNSQAKIMFDQIAPHYQKEILRYINSLKSQESIDRNVKRAIEHLLGKARFVARNPPKPE